MSTVKSQLRQWFSTRSDFAPRKHLALSKDILIVITGDVGVLLASGGEHPTMHSSALFFFFWLRWVFVAVHGLFYSCGTWAVERVGFSSGA